MDVRQTPEFSIVKLNCVICHRLPLLSKLMQNISFKIHDHEYEWLIIRIGLGSSRNFSFVLSMSIHFSIETEDSLSYPTSYLFIFISNRFKSNYNEWSILRYILFVQDFRRSISISILIIAVIRVKAADVRFPHVNPPPAWG